MLFEVLSGEKDGTNGNSPKRKTVRAKDYDTAAFKAPVIGKGKIHSVICTEYDADNRVAYYIAATTDGGSFKVVVQEIFWTTYVLKKVF